MSPAQQTGEWHHIYNVGADSCSIRIAGSGTNLIESTGVVRLDAQSQHAYLESLGNGLWGGDVQATPWSVFTTQDDVGTFSVSGASVVYSCPIFILTPLGFEGVRVNRTANTGQFSAAIFNMNNQYVVGVSTQQTINAVNNYMSGGVYQVSPGWYKLLFTMNNTTVQISGSNTVNSNKMFCSTVGTAANMDLSKFTPSAGSVDSNSYPAVDLIFNGGDQGF